MKRRKEKEIQNNKKKRKKKSKNLTIQMKINYLNALYADGNF